MGCGTSAALEQEPKSGQDVSNPQEVLAIRDACVRALAGLPSDFGEDTHKSAVALGEALTKAAVGCRVPLLQEVLLNLSYKATATISAYQQVRANGRSAYELARVTFDTARALLGILAKGAKHLVTKGDAFGTAVDNIRRYANAVSRAMRCITNLSASGENLLTRVLDQSVRSDFEQADNLLRRSLENTAEALQIPLEPPIMRGNYDRVITMDDLQQMGGTNVDALKQKLDSLDRSVRVTNVGRRPSGISKFLEAEYAKRKDNESSSRSYESQELAKRTLRVNLLLDADSPAVFSVGEYDGTEASPPYKTAAIRAREAADQARSAAELARKAAEIASEEARLAVEEICAREAELGASIERTIEARYELEAEAKLSAHPSTRAESIPTQSSDSPDRLEAELKRPAGGAIARGKISTSSSEYHGGILDHRRHGYGMIFLDDDWYQGQFEQGMRHGHGVQQEGCGGTYEGELSHDEFDGVGVYRFSNGERYAGEMAAGFFSGYGCYIWPSGERFEGEFREDKRNGWGIMMDHKGTIVRKGMWKGDARTETDVKL